MLALALAGGCERRSPPPVAAPAPAVEPWLPTAAISHEVVAVVRVDMQAATGPLLRQTIAAIGQTAADPTPDNARPAHPMLADFDRFQQAFVSAGGQTIVMGVRRGPARDATPLGVFLLLGVAESVDPVAFTAAIDAAMATPTSTTVARYAPGWFRVDGEQLASVPTEGTAVLASAMRETLAGAVGQAQVAFRLDPSLRQALAAAAELDADADRMTPDLLRALTQMTHGSMDLTLGPRPKLAARMAFVDEASASAFSRIYDALMRHGQLQRDPADPANPFAFTQHGATLTLEVDQHALRRIDRLGPVLSPMILGLIRSMSPRVATAADPGL